MRFTNWIKRKLSPPDFGERKYIKLTPDDSFYWDYTLWEVKDKNANCPFPLYNPQQFVVADLRDGWVIGYTRQRLSRLIDGKQWYTEWKYGERMRFIKLQSKYDMLGYYYEINLG